jgi:hypothetical protein
MPGIVVHFQAKLLHDTRRLRKKCATNAKFVYKLGVFAATTISLRCLAICNLPRHFLHFAILNYADGRKLARQPCFSAKSYRDSDARARIGIDLLSVRLNTELSRSRYVPVVTGK